jgi:hypothetical protein
MSTRPLSQTATEMGKSKPILRPLNTTCPMYGLGEVLGIRGDRVDNPGYS